jgi:branched-chain amino acid transport system ATP-binding protein
MRSPSQDHGRRPMLTLENVRAAYVKREVLRGVSFSVMEGEVVALFGGNGSGKSTTLKTIGGLLKPIQGRIVFGEQEITHATVQQRQRLGIGYLLQGGQVFPNLLVGENFHIARRHASRRIGSMSADGVGAELPANTSFALGDLFPVLREREGDRAGLLSGGQQQMLAIELVVAQSPSLLLLDEPTGSLSPDLARALLGRIAQYAAQASCAVLLVEQNVTESLQVADRCLRLLEGTVEEMSDSSANLRREP